MLLFDQRPSTLAGAPTNAPPSAGGGSKAGIKSVYDVYLPEGGSDVLLTPDPPPAGLKPEDAAKLASILSPQVMQALTTVSLAKYLAPYNPLTQKGSQTPGVDLYAILSDATDKRTFDLTAFEARIRCWELLNAVYALACSWQDYQGPEGTQAQVQKLVDKALAWLPPKGSATGDTWRTAVSSIPGLVKAIKAAEVEYMKAQLTTVGGQGGAAFLLSEVGGSYDAVGWFGPVACNPNVALYSETSLPDPITQTPTLSKTLVYPIPDIYMRSAAREVEFGASKPMFAFEAMVPGLADYKPYSEYNYNGADVKQPRSSNTAFTFKDTAFVDNVGWDTPADKWPDQPVMPQSKWTPDPSKLPPNKSDPNNMLADFLHHQWDRLGGQPFIDAVQYQTPMNDLTQRLRYEVVLGRLIWEGLYDDPEFSGEYGGNAKTPHQVADLIIPKVRAAQDAKRLALMTPSNYATLDVTDPNKPAYPVVSKQGGPWAKVYDARNMLVAAIQFVCFLPPMELDWVYEPYKTDSGQTVTDVAPKPVLLIQRWRHEVKETTAYANLQARLKQLAKDCLGGKLLDASLLVDMMATWVVEGVVYSGGKAVYTGEQIKRATSYVKYKDWGKKGESASVFQRAKDLSGDYAKLYAWQPTKDKALPIPLVFKLNPDKVSDLYKQATEEAKASTAGLSEPQKVYVNARSEVKSQLLLSMMASQLATDAQDTTEDMIVALNDMAVELYGCSIPEPPKDLTDPQKVLDYYKQEMLACAKNPKKGSLAYQLNELLVQFAKLKALVDAGDQTAVPALTAVSAKISELQAKMAALASLRGARRNRAMDNTTDKGGTLSNLGLSTDLLGTVFKLKDEKINLNIGGRVLSIPLVPSNDAAKADGVAAKNETTKKRADAALDYVVGSGEALQALGESYSLPIPPAVSETIKTNEQVAINILVPEAKKPSNLWLWLLLGGAVAYSQSKK